MRRILIYGLLWCLWKLGYEMPVIIVPMHTLQPSQDWLRDSSTFVKTVQ